MVENTSGRKTPYAVAFSAQLKLKKMRRGISPHPLIWNAQQKAYNTRNENFNEAERTSGT